MVESIIIHGYTYSPAELAALPRYWNHRYSQFSDGLTLALTYQAAGFDAIELARQIGCSDHAVYAALNWYGLRPISACEPTPRAGFCPSCGLWTGGDGPCAFCQAGANRVLYQDVTGPACPAIHRGQAHWGRP